MKSWIRWANVTIVLVLVIVDSVGVGSLMRHPWISGATTAVLLVAAPVYTRRAYTKPFKAKPGSFPRDQVPDIRARRLLSDAERERSIGAPQAKIFALAVTDPAALRQRVVEDYDPNRRTLHQTVSVQVQVPAPMLQAAQASPEQNLFFPTLLAKKGTLQDGFDVFDGGNTPASVLSYREYLKFAAAVLHGLLATAYGLHVSDPLPKVARDAELFAIMAMMKRAQPEAANTAPDYSGAEALERLTVRTAAVRTLAANFVRKLTTHYAIVAVIPSHCNGRFLVRYQRILIPDVKLSDPDTKRRLTLKGWLRMALGAKPVEVTIELDNASTCQSYHLRVNGPEGLYLASQETIDMDAIVRRTARDAPTPPYCRFRRRLGQPHAHFYARYFPEIDLKNNERPRIKFRYFEIPPGSNFRAFVTATACLALVWLTGFVSTQTAILGSQSDARSDIPALLLAFPALAATWLGFESPSGRLFEGTLAARCCLMMTAILSLSASGLFMAHNLLIEGPQRWLSLPGHVSILSVADLGWAILIAFALVNWVYIAYRAYIATWSYAYLSSRQDD